MSLQDYTNVTECITCGEPTADVREFIRKHAGAFRRYAIPCHSRWSIKGTTDGCEETLTARLSDERLWPAIEALNDLLWRLATASGPIEVDQTSNEMRADLATFAASLEHDERPVGVPTLATDGVVFAPLEMTVRSQGEDGFRAQARTLMQRLLTTQDAESVARVAHFNGPFTKGTRDAWHKAQSERDEAFQALADFCLKEP